MKTLKELIANGFNGYTRERIDFYDPSDLPDHSWTNDWDGGQIRRFSEGEKFERMTLRTWLCTDTIVGLYAIIWNDVFIGLTYQSCRKGDKDWIFMPDREDQMRVSFNTYWREPDAEPSCQVIEGDLWLNLEIDPNAKYDWRTGPF